MKNLMRILSVLLAFAGLMIVIALLNPTSASEFHVNLLRIVLDSFIPLVSISICAYCMEKNDNNYLVRILPIYLTIPIVLSIMNVVFGLNTGFTVDLYKFFSYTFLETLGLALIIVIKPNNVITKGIRYMAYVLFALAVIFSLIVNYSADTISLNNLSSLSLTYTISETYKMYLIITIAQIFTILLLYLTNYAFSDKVEVEASDIDYDTVKQEATALANAQMNNIYNLAQKNNEPDRSASEKGLMNVNNQLGNNSNVGTVNTQAREVNVAGSTLDSLMPLSKGPVINSTINEEKEQTIETTPPVEEKVEDTLPPNLDIQEQMKLRSEQNQNILNQ